MNLLRVRLRAARVHAASSVGSGRRAIEAWLSRVGKYRERTGTASVPVPGTDRSIPLYLLVPGAQRGPRAMVYRATMVFAATAATTATLWSMFVIGLAGGDTDIPGVLAGGSVVVWLLTALSWYRAWLRRPRSRPFATDLSRW